jgi:hypothetical protein
MRIEMRWIASNQLTKSPELPVHLSRDRRGIIARYDLVDRSPSARNILPLAEIDVESQTHRGMDQGN